MTKTKRLYYWFLIKVLRRQYIYLEEEALGTKIARFHRVGFNDNHLPFGYAYWWWAGERYSVNVLSNRTWYEARSNHFQGEWRFVSLKKPMEFNIKAKRERLRKT